MRVRVILIAVVFATALAVAQVKEFKPVTDAMLRSPGPGDWLHWRRTYDSWGYSPLDQINRQTVNQLQLVWAWAMEPGSQQPTPLVYDGVMYLASPNYVVHALDAATGDLLWEYRREPAEPQGGRGRGGAGAAAPGSNRPVRNIAIYQDKLYMTTGDAHVIALDARSGEVAWEVQVSDPKLGFTFSAGPLAIPGKIITSLSGCARYQKEKCAIVALDARTGKELWRKTTIAAPGEPGGDTWGDLPLVFRAGTDMWITGTYDPDLNLIYWSTSQAKPWARFQRGTDGDALFSNTTFALEPETGKVVWWRQFTPGETQDMDDIFEHVLVDSGTQKSMFKMGKLGILWQLDRRTGKHIKATDLGYQNIVRLDPAAGKVTYRPDKIPQPAQEVDFCPDLSGVRAQWTMSYSPETRAFYIPIEHVCARAVFGPPGERVEGRGGGGGAMRNFYLNRMGDGNLGEFAAMDSVTGKILWRHRQRATLMTSALTTAGGLAFVGDYDRYVRAFDVKTGAVLWQTRTASSPHGFLVSYAVRGKQYVAIPVGIDGGGSWSNAIPPQLTPEIKRPKSGNAVYVFALPESPGRQSQRD